MQTHTGADVTQVLHSVEALAQLIKDSVDTMESERRLPPALARALYGGRRLPYGRPSCVWRCRV